MKRKKITKMDRLTAAVAQTYGHDSTADVFRRRDVLTFEGVVVEQEIVALQAKLADAKAHRARIEATLAGLTEVITRR